MSSIRPDLYFALVDCNQFFVSCERVFNPRLNKRPVVVLSCNDGCVIARSPEAKALGIPMGAPAFAYQSLFETQKVAVFSSNFTLYADMSRRVMEILKSYGIYTQIYSIDEAFLVLEKKNLESLCKQIREQILKWTGIPVSIGAAKTKTLAKVAGDLAKKKPEGWVVLKEEEIIRKTLQSYPVEDVWGIGHRLEERLKAYGIFYALDFCEQKDHWLRKEFSVVGLRTAMELRGQVCLNIEEEPIPNKTMICSRSFGRPLIEFNEVAEALASYVATAAEKLREQGLVARVLEVFLLTKPDYLEGSYANKALFAFPEPTAYTPHLISMAKAALKSIFCEGVPYKKTGVIFSGISPEHGYQRDLFAPKENRNKQEALMKVIDQLNLKYGYPAIKFGAEGLQQEWGMKRQHCTQKFTSDWSELLTIP